MQRMEWDARSTQLLSLVLQILKLNCYGHGRIAACQGSEELAHDPANRLVVCQPLKQRSRWIRMDRSMQRFQRWDKFLSFNLFVQCVKCVGFEMLSEAERQDIVIIKAILGTARQVARIFNEIHPERAVFLNPTWLKNKYLFIHFNVPVLTNRNPRKAIFFSSLPLI